MTARISASTEWSLPLPHSLDTRIHLRLTTQAKAILLFLTTAAQDEAAAPKPMGSLVYALPDRFNPQQPLATTLFSSEATVEFSTRLARILARKTQMPVYVTNSMSFENAGMGGTVEEEMEALKNIVDVTLGKIRTSGPKSGDTVANGISPDQS